MKTKLVEENWKQKSDGWKSNEIDAHLFFGWKAMDNESPVPMSFVFDNVGIRDHIRQCIEKERNLY